MLKFLIDEDMPRSIAKVLNGKGYEALDVRDCGLRGKSDGDVFEFARKEEAVILTADVGFGNPPFKGKLLNQGLRSGADLFFGKIREPFFKLLHGHVCGPCELFETGR